MRAGADIVELGVPFSDPLADGATIQASSHTALQNGTKLRDCLETAADLRREHDGGIVLMGYANPFMAFGLEKLAKAAGEAGVDGLIVPDLPPDEAAEFEHAFASRGLDLIYMLAPTSSDSRVRLVAARASGFIYCVSLAGTTGERERLAEGVDEFLARVRRHTHLPRVVGFGISRPEHVGALRGKAEGVIVGSAYVRLADRASPGRLEHDAGEFVASLVAAARA